MAACNVGVGLTVAGIGPSDHEGFAPGPALVLVVRVHCGESETCSPTLAAVLLEWDSYALFVLVRHDLILREGEAMKVVSAFFPF